MQIKVNTASHIIADDQLASCKYWLKKWQANKKGTELIHLATMYSVHVTHDIIEPLYDQLATSYNELQNHQMVDILWFFGTCSFIPAEISQK